MITSAPSQLPVASLRLRFQAATDGRLPRHTGSAWRGAFGHALRQLACVTGQRECSVCMLYRSCAYSYVFKTPPPPEGDVGGRFQNPPQPFVFETEPGRSLAAGDDVILGVNLFGRGVAHLPYIVHALRTAGAGGVGGSRPELRTHFRLVEVSQEHPPSSGNWRSIYQEGTPIHPVSACSLPIPPTPLAIQIKLLTPLRLKRDKRHVVPGEFEFSDLYASLVRRISLLCAIHTETPWQTDFTSLISLSRDVPCRVSLHWDDSMDRHSSSQEADMTFGGLLGEIELHSPYLAPFWPLLWLGQWTHAGNNTAFGLGWYRLEIEG